MIRSIGDTKNKINLTVKYERGGGGGCHREEGLGGKKEKRRQGQEPPHYGLPCSLPGSRVDT